MRARESYGTPGISPLTVYTPRVLTTSHSLAIASYDLIMASLAIALELTKWTGASPPQGFHSLPFSSTSRVAAFLHRR